MCVAYEVDGKRHDELPTNRAELARAVPVYETFPGWTEDISAVRTLEDLPTNCRDYVTAVQKMIKAPISAVGVGPVGGIEGWFGRSDFGMDRISQRCHDPIGRVPYTAESRRIRRS